MSFYKKNLSYRVYHLISILINMSCANFQTCVFKSAYVHGLLYVQSYYNPKQGMFKIQTFIQSLYSNVYKSRIFD